jgi:hypothetical protein
MDDIQDKVRRNLVVVAAAVILIQLLHVEISPKATDVSIFTVSKVSQLKFWILALAVLVYLFQRYWFDKATRDQSADTVKEFHALRTPRIIEKLRREIRGHVDTGKVPKFVEGFHDVVKQFHSAHYPPDTFDEIHVGLQRNPTDRPWSRDGKLNIELTRISKGKVVSNVMSDWRSSYRLSFGDMLCVSVVPVFRTALFSKSSVDFLVPLYLAAGAVGVTMFRLWMVVAAT